MLSQIQRINLNLNLGRFETITLNIVTFYLVTQVTRLEATNQSGILECFSCLTSERKV